MVIIKIKQWSDENEISFSKSYLFKRFIKKIQDNSDVELDAIELYVLSKFKAEKIEFINEVARIFIGDFELHLSQKNGKDSLHLLNIKNLKTGDFRYIKNGISFEKKYIARTFTKRNFKR